MQIQGLLKDPFVFGASAPAAPTLLTPNSTTEATFLARWNSSAGATGYRVDVSTNSLFSSFVSGWNNTDVGNVTSVRVIGVVPGTLFYRVRAYNLIGTSASSTPIEASYYTFIRALNSNSNLNVNDGGSIAVACDSDNNVSTGNIGWTSQGLLFVNTAAQVVSFNCFGIDSSQTNNPNYTFVDGDTMQNGPNYNGPINGDQTPGGGPFGLYAFDFDATGMARKSTTVPSDFQQFNFDGTVSGLTAFNLFSGLSYSVGGTASLAVTSGKKYQITWGKNDISAVNGVQNFSPYVSVIFTATAATISLTGTPSTPVTAMLLLLN